MGLQDTASKTALLLVCQRPFAPDTPIVREEPTEPMRYGSAFHELLEHSSPRAEKVAETWGIPHLATELHKHAIRAMSALTKWMRGDNPWREVFTPLSREVPMASRIWFGKSGQLHVKTRPCDFEKETHTYDLRDGETGGTSDLNLVGASGRRVVLDYKTGDWGEFHTPSALPQMRTLALQTSSDAVAILHAPREGVPVIYAEELDPKEQYTFARARRKAMRRIGDGSLRPGAWCARCPARESCPAKDGEMLVRASSLIRHAVTSEELARPVDKGAFHMFLTELGRLEKRAREVLRADVKAGEIIARPDGKVLVLREQEYETLSKSSIVRALGKKKGEALIEKLRKMGCVPKETREELRAVEDR